MGPIVQLKNRFELLSQIRDNDEDLVLPDAKTAGANIAPTGVVLINGKTHVQNIPKTSQNKLAHMECPTKSLGMLIIV